MHERNRRQLCRLLFFALCVVPTFVSASWAAYRSSSYYASTLCTRWEEFVYQRTGLATEIERVEHLSGRSTLLHGIVLTDPDGGDRVATIRLVEIAATQDGTAIAFSQPQIASGQFLRLWDAFHERVLRGPTRTTNLQLSSGEVTVEFGKHAQTFTRVHCTVEAAETGVRATVDLQLAGREMPSPARIVVHRNRQLIPASTDWSLESDTALPCALFADYLPWAERLGPEATFRGRVAMAQTRDEWRAEATGVFANVDLGRVTELLPHKLTGLTEVAVDKVFVKNGELQNLSGECSGTGGIVSPLLLVALREHLGALVPLELIDWPEPYVTYGDLKFAFDLSADGLKVIGKCPATNRGVVMNSPAGKLLMVEHQSTYPLTAMVRALAPKTQSLIPATDESKWLIDVLALPTERVLPTNGIATPPRARMRLR